MGSPSWTQFEAKFRVRNVTAGMALAVQRTPNLRSQFENRYEEASLAVPAEAAKGSAWVEGRIVVGPKEAVLWLAGKEIARSAFSSVTSETILLPIRVGFLRSNAGGQLELRDLEVRVKARGGGF